MNDLVEKVIAEVEQEHPELKVVKSFKDVLPSTPVDLVIPPGYKVDPSEGIIDITIPDRPKVISDAIVLPTAKVKDTENDDKPKLRLQTWNHSTGGWEKNPFLVNFGVISTTREIGQINSGMVIAFSEDQKAGAAKFFHALWSENNKFYSLPEIYRIHSCGWTRDNLFYPYTTQEGIIEVNAPKDSIMEGIEREIKLFPTGSIDKAKAVIHKQKDNPVFVLMLAGCLASPLVPLLKGMLNENIGIDLFGKTSAGKTSIQTIAMDLIYGLGDMLKTSWSKATPAGIWNTAKAINNLPFIMDDSHRMPEKLYGYPHDLINGKEGQKSTATENGDWTGKDTNKDAYQGVLLFNGEISIHSVNPNDSAGLYGRVFMINEPPFPMNVGAVYVESLKDEAMSNRGHFACPWIEFIAKSDMEEMKNKIRELDSLFDRSGKDGLFGRLATKAQVLVLCLQMFNQLFQTDLNVDSMVELLTKSMEEQTDNVNVADRQMKIILDTVLEKSNGAQWTPKDCMFIDLNNPHNTFNLGLAE